MAIVSDALLQRLIDESSNGNEHLKSMKELLVSIDRKSGRRGSGGSGSPPDRRNDRDQNSQGAFTGTLKSIFGEMQGLSGTILGNAGSVQNTASSLGTSLGNVGAALSNLPGPIGMVGTAFSAIATVSTALYESMNEQLNMYNALNSSGLSLSAGMMSVRKGSAGAFMSMNDFSEAITRNSDAIAAMDDQYGDGVEHFGRLMNSIQNAQNGVNAYGLSQQQLADVTARNYKFNKIFSTEQQMNRMNESQSTQTFVGQMTYLSKTVGRSVDELLKKFDSMTDNLDTTMAEGSLKTLYGLPAEIAAGTTKATNAVFASMGEAGDTLQKLNSSKLSMFMLPEEYNNTFVQEYTDMIANLQKNGVTDEKVIRRTMSKWTAERKGWLDQEIDIQTRSGNIQIATLLNQIKNTEKLLNDPSKQPNLYYENMMTRFNLWIGDNFTKPLNEYFARSQEQLSKYLTNLANTTDNAYDFAEQLFRDGFNKINDAMGGWLMAPLKMFQELGKILMGEQYPLLANEMGIMFDSVMEIPKQLTKTLIEWASGGDLYDVSAGLRIAVKMMFEDIGNSIKNLMTIDIEQFNYEAVKTRIKEAFQGMLDSVIKFWDKLTAWWNTDDSKAIEQRRAELQEQRQTVETQSTAKQRNTSQKVQTNTDYTKPQKIEEAEVAEQEKYQDDSADLMASQRADSTNRLLSTMVNILETQASQTAQQLAMMRQVAENTEPARNV